MLSRHGSCTLPQSETVRQTEGVRTNLCRILRATRMLYLWALHKASMHLTGLPAIYIFLSFTNFVSYGVVLRAYVPVFLRRKIDFLFLYLLCLLRRTAAMTKVSNPGVFRRKVSNLYFIKFSCTLELNEDINFEYRTLKPCLKYCKYWCACTRISLYSWIIYVENFRHNATGGILYANLL